MIEIRSYQIEAINNFKKNNWKGILEMATGTGKTITSLLIADEYKKKDGRIFLIILVPFTHLAEQWVENCENMGFYNVLKCYESKKKWIYNLESRVRDFNIKVSDIEVVISTYKTASVFEFSELLLGIKSNSFIICDECHYLGSKSFRNDRLDFIEGRLGLSATPDRWWDEEGTNFLKKYFEEIVYEYDIEKAISNGVLTEYKYNPIPVDLTESEVESYKKLTKKLIALLNSKDKPKDEIEEINRKRSKILSKAENKKYMLYSIFRRKKIEEVFHTLIYCASGEINEIVMNLSKIGYKVHKFDSTVILKDRKKILKLFSLKKIQILVAIKCLDEGVDIPSTKVAYFLASTSNPREFIQRRGRILRKAEGKNLAQIHDFIVIPELADDNLYIAIVGKELPRFAEFSKYAIDRFKARAKIMPMIKSHGMEHLLDKLPWDAYYEMVERFGDVVNEFE